MNIKNRPVLLKTIFWMVAVYVFATSLFFFVDTFILRRVSNDQCLWVEEEVEGKRRIFIRNILQGGVADLAGIHENDILVAINDTLIRSPFHAQSIINKAREQDTLIYSVERAGVVKRFPLQIIRSYNPVYFAFSVLGFSFLVIGLIVGVSRPTDRVPRLFFRMATAAALVFVVGGVVFFGSVDYRGGLAIFWLTNLIPALALFPAFFIHFFIRFPYEKGRVEVRRWLVPLIYTVSVLVALTPIVSVVLYHQFSGLGFFLFFTQMGVGYGIFCHSYFSIEDRNRRRPLTSILVGTAIGLLGFVYLAVVVMVVPVVFINHPEFLVGTIVVALIPLSFGYSIFRYRIMDIEIIVRRSLVYALATAHIALLYLAVLYVTGYIVEHWLGTFEQSGLVNAGILIATALLFAPIKDRIQEVVDRRFFRERYDYQKALLRFSQELPSLIRLDEILHKVIQTMTTTMHVERMAVCLYDPDKKEPAAYVDQGVRTGRCDFSAEPGGIVERLAHSRSPQTMYEVNFSELHMRPSESSCIRECGVVLAVPLFKQDRLIGVMYLGPKMSGKPYSQEDLDLLTTVASQAGIAIENARLHKEELEKARLENELSVARRIQQHLLPRESPRLHGLDIFGTSIPALSVGGDYYDYIPLSERQLLVAIGDVSGKGASAALYMSRIQGMIQMASRLYRTPREILLEVNRQMFHSMDRQSFVTLILALLDLDRRTISVCRAGHNPLIAMLNGTFNLIQCRGIGVGLAPNEVFEQQLEEQTKPVERGNTFVFYTDGITEAMNGEREEYGDDRLYRLVQSHPGLSSEALTQRVIADVRQFCGPAEQSDDITLVVARIG